VFSGMDANGVTEHVLLRQTLHLMARANEVLYACRDCPGAQAALASLREAVIDLRPYTTALASNGRAPTRPQSTAARRR